MKGEMKCPFSLPSTGTPSTTEVSLLSTAVESSLSPSTRRVTNPNTHTASSGSPTVTMSTTETSIPMVIKTDTTNTSSDERLRSGLIAGAVAGVIGMVALVIAIVLVRRRKRRRTVAKRTSVNAGEENDHDGTDRVQRSLEDQYEYSYADTSAVSIDKRDVDHNPRIKVAQSSHNVTNSMYGVSAGSPPHILNISKDSEYTQVNKKTSNTQLDGSAEPLYYVLEGPESDGPNSNEPPYYHVLEEQHPDAGPVYDVLEEPGSKARLPNQNSAWKMCNARSEVEENRGYNDTVYDSVEEVITDTGDIYQQLNQDDQREPGVYQAPTYTNQAMPMAKLNGTHDSEA